TMPSGTLPPAPAGPSAAESPRRSRLPWLLGGIGSLAIAAVVVVVMRGRHDDREVAAPAAAQQSQSQPQPPSQSQPQPPSQSQSQPPSQPQPPSQAQPQSPSQAQPQQAQAPGAQPSLGAAGAAAIDGGVPAAAPSTHATPPKKPRGAGPKPPPSHDSHSIEDPFAK
ncbi:MAG TPA: hypothetical protein VLT45_15255, partial [Kofleriaceae bacterium]|nr:hypothetical protein [Kofleriaceae bacterium]